MVCKDKDIKFLDSNTPQTFLQASTIPFYSYCSLLIQKFSLNLERNQISFSSNELFPVCLFFYHLGLQLV